MKREIRSSAVAGMAGVGAVVDVGQESFLIPGISGWRQGALRVIDLKRLSSRLHKVLKAPKEEKPTLLIRRFPRAMFCEKCRMMILWKTAMEQDDSEPLCPQDGCGGKLVPMRFVSACENGHLSDVDWRYWAHSGGNGNRGCKTQDKLSFTVDTSAATGGLASIRVQCTAPGCGSSRSLEDLSNKSIIKETFKKCSGSHPWINDKHEECSADVVILQRGATNLHYPSTISALDIPTDVVENPAAQFAEQIRQHSKYQKLINYLKSTEGDTSELASVYAELLAEAVGCEPAVVLEVAGADVDGRVLVGAGGTTEEGTIDQALLLDEEWRTIEAALQAGELISQNFAAVSEELSSSAPSWMKGLVSGVLLIRRLREVRAYLGFQRVKPDAAKTVRPDVGAAGNWLPASEVFGEGIVLALNFDLLEKWAASISDEEKASLKVLEDKRLVENFWFLPRVDPIFFAIHTLSHLLLRRITFECGYSSSSLRERLYFNAENKYAAIMIYTADGDSEGSLGGLVRQGRRDRLAQSIIEAVDQGRWCSSDPVCSETAGQGLGGFNHAACHACSLVSETSCTAANTLLDRRMLFEQDWGLLNFLERIK
jgi:hypothetical protein